MSTEHSEHGEDFDPLCPACCAEAVAEEFWASAGAPVRVTEATGAAAVDDGAMEEALAAVLEGLDDAGVSELAELAEAAIAELASKATEAADVDEHVVEAHVGFKKLAAKLAAKGAHNAKALAAWIGRKKYGKKAFQALAKAARKAKAKAKGKKTSEAHIGGEMSFDDVKDAVRRALRARVASETGRTYCWVSVLDLTSSEVVYCSDGGMDSPYDERELMQCSYTIDGTGAVTLGTPEKVVRAYAPAPAAGGSGTGAGEAVRESEQRDQDHIDGRVLEAKGEDGDGGRVYRVRIIAYGDSKNGRRYPQNVLESAAPMYEGARAYDHHRTEGELRSSTIHGLVGSYRNVEATSGGLDADLHLLPGATHAAEALDATIAAQDEGRPPLIGLSHDVMAKFRPVTDGGRRMQEATAITKVHSADLVADPAAGGQATRAVAGGIEGSGTEPAEEEEGDVPTKEEILAAFAEASDEELAAVGLARAAENDEGGDGGEGTEGRETEAATVPKAGFLGGLMIERKVEAAGLPAAVIEGVAAALPEQITEADVDAQISSLKSIAGIAERAGLAGDGVTVTVTQEALDKKRAALDGFFDQDWSKGYHSFKEAFADFTGRRPRTFDEDFNRVVLRESFGAGFHSAARAEEALDSTSWAQVLGDSVTRRMVAMYALPSLQSWRQIVSSIVPVNDFRTQRIGRTGGYGELPDVAEGDPYTALTSPTDEEATYAISKRGGTEKLTLEMIANDDIRAISNIPRKLGRAAAQTLFRFVWDFIRTNAVCSYDSTALFDATHANTGVAALSATSLAAARQALMEQTAYDDANELLALDIAHLVVPPALYDLAYRLVKSDRAVTATEDATTPNVNQGINLITVPYFTSDDNNWYAVADTNMCPTIEVGFYQGRQDPELFTQNDPNVGSVFDSDSIMYKIRHMYSGTILDHRGMYGALVP